MSLRFRRSVKILPGVRINFNKNSTGLTFGGRGAHYTINSSGRRTASVGLPGTGLWWQESYNKNTQRRRMAAQPEVKEYEKPVEQKAKPSFLAKNYENDLYKALMEMSADKFRAAIEKYPEAEMFGKFMLVSILMASAKTSEEGQQILEEVWSRVTELMKDKIYRKYAPGIYTKMQIVPGVYYIGPYTCHLLGYILAETYQQRGEFDKAEKIVKEISEDSFTPIILCEIHFNQKKYDEVLKVTDNLSTDTNENAAMEMYRAMVFREKGDFEAALTILTEIVKNRNLDKSLTIRSRYERALTYAKSGDIKKQLADFEYILTKDSDYLDVNELIAKLKKTK